MTTVVDAHGRTVTVTTNVDGSGEDQYVSGGITVTFPTGTDQAVALSAFNAMSPTSIKINWTFVEFTNLFTSDEQAAIVTSDDPKIRLFVLLAANATAIQLDNSQIVSGVQYLVSAGLLTSDRATAILAGQAP